MNELPEPTEEATERPHISPSQLNRYFTCGEQYRRIYVCKERIPPGIALLKGSSVHQAAEYNYREKMVTRADVPEGMLNDVAVEEFQSRVLSEGIELSAEESAVGVDISLGRAKDSIVRMTTAFRREIAPGVTPTMVEERIRVPLGLASHDMLGIIDVVDDRRVIHDLKTSSRSKSPDDLETDQFSFYAAAYEVATGHPAAGIQMDVVVDTKVAKTQQIRATRGQKDKGVLAARVNAMLSGLNAGVFLPATPGHWACTQKFCGFWRTCPYVNAERRAAAQKIDG